MLAVEPPYSQKVGCFTLLGKERDACKLSAQGLAHPGYGSIGSHVDMLALPAGRPSYGLPVSNPYLYLCCDQNNLTAIRDYNYQVYNNDTKISQNRL